MISICVPIYNCNVDLLAADLLTQIEALSEKAELILIDDCSDRYFQEHNKHQGDKKNVSYIQLKENIGRAAIRNLFLKHAKYNHLLFLDCDALVVDSNFIQNYLKGIVQNPMAVICGGRVYPQEKVNRSRRLRWKYGINREQKSAAERRKNPYASFMTNNFIVPKKTLDSIQFDEQLKGYGHEDTLFGFELKKSAIEIKHIENAILNGEIESNADYLRNTVNAIQNLCVILDTKDYNRELIQDISLLRLYFKIQYLKYFIAAAYYILKPFIRWTLLNGWVNLYLFDFYKLGFLNKTLMGKEGL